jgi:hypothetical protein
VWGLSEFTVRYGMLWSARESAMICEATCEGLPSPDSALAAAAAAAAAGAAAAASSARNDLPLLLVLTTTRAHAARTMAPAAAATAWRAQVLLVLLRGEMERCNVW